MKSAEDLVWDFLKLVPDEYEGIVDNVMMYLDNKSHIYQWMVSVMRKKDNMERYSEVNNKLNAILSIISELRGQVGPKLQAKVEEYKDLYEFVTMFRRYIIGFFDAETQSLMTYDVKLKI